MIVDIYFATWNLTKPSSIPLSLSAFWLASSLSSLSTVPLPSSFCLLHQYLFLHINLDAETSRKQQDKNEHLDTEVAKNFAFILLGI